MTITPTKKNLLIKTVAIFATIFILSGCAAMEKFKGGGDTDADSGLTDTMPGNEPYYTNDYRDILIPGELTWNREDSVVLATSSFTGGVLNFSGRVEVNSLTDFFVNSMKKDKWNLTGSIKAENVLLAFVKTNSTCLIRIFAGGVTSKTSVNVYVTKTK